MARADLTKRPYHHYEPARRRALFNYLRGFVEKQWSLHRRVCLNFFSNFVAIRDYFVAVGESLIYTWTNICGGDY